MDYGHPLLFGTFITPVNSPPDAPVARAVLAERLGYDLVTFQDHPYQPSFHDTWTLLTWVAAQTSRIHLAANVHNLPLRPPAVLARAAASLDLLSGGRFELALGAGAFREAVAAMGGAGLAPGESIQALEEAIRIIRGIWAADEPRPLRVDGRFHRVDGAKRGPAPVHDMPIWVGAYGPKMLRLTGRLADGWLPSLAYADRDAVRAGNAAIDAAASDAGRDPREVRRLLNVGGRFADRSGGVLVGPPSQWIDELSSFVLDDGVSAFILASDDPATMQRFAEEVAPAVRERVARERADAGTPTGAVRPAAVLAKRRPGIRYDDVPEGLEAIEPGDARYRSVRGTYFQAGSPGLVLLPRDAEQVSKAVRFAREHPDLPLSVRSGGHGISGRSTNDGGLIIDLRHLDGIEVVDDDARRVRVGAGARWMDVAAALAERGWAITSGDYGGVGVGGLAVAGGVGYLGRLQGLTIDRVRAAEVVLADGEIVRATAEDHPDLFWGLRGAGAMLGIATSFELEAGEVGDVGWAQLVFDVGDDVEGFLERWGAVVEAAPRTLTSFVLFGGQPGRRIAQTMSVVAEADPDRIVEVLTPLAGIAPLVGQEVNVQPYAAVMANASGEEHVGGRAPEARSAIVEHLDALTVQRLAAALDSSPVRFFQIRAIGGAVGDVPADATAFSGRAGNFVVSVLGADRDAMDRVWEPVRELAVGSYLSFETGDVEAVYPPAVLARLRDLKAEVDPDGVFRGPLELTATPEFTSS